MADTKSIYGEMKDKGWKEINGVWYDPDNVRAYEAGRMEAWELMNTWCKVFTCAEAPNTKTTMWCDRYNDATRACAYATCPLMKGGE
jgi:hypothetical protein